MASFGLEAARALGRIAAIVCYRYAGHGEVGVQAKPMSGGSDASLRSIRES